MQYCGGTVDADIGRQTLLLCYFHYAGVKALSVAGLNMFVTVLEERSGGHLIHEGSSPQQHEYAQENVMTIRFL